MVKVTDKAASKLRDMKNELPTTEQSFRLVVQQSDGSLNIGLLPDMQKDGDAIVENDGEKVLLVDQLTSDMLDGAKIDLVETPQGEQLAIGPEE